MKKFTSISLIFMIIFSNFTYGVTAAVTEGVKNDVLNSEYVVIVNTSSKENQSTGKIVFDENNNNNTRIGQEINSQSENINEDLIVNQLKNENTEIKAENKSLSEEISSMKEKQDRMSEELSTIRTQFTSMTNIINQFSSGTSQPEMEGHSTYVKQ